MRRLVAAVHNKQLRDMASNRVVVLIWLAAMVGLDLVLFASLPGTSPPALNWLFFYACMFANVSLAAIWLFAGGGSSLLRMFGAAITLGLVFSLLELARHLRDGLTLLVVQMAIIGIPLFLLRLRGTRLVSQDDKTAIDLTESRQFGLKHVLLATLALGLLSATVRGLVKPNHILGSGWAVLSLYALAFAAISLLATWAAMGTTALWIRLLVFAVLIGPMSVCVAFIENSDYEVIPLPLIHAGLVAASLLIFRAQGYCFRRRREATAASEGEVRAASA